MISNLDSIDIDLYQARMLIGYFKSNMHNIHGVMEAFCRKLPQHRRFLVACGIERIIDYLANIKITATEINILKKALPDVVFDSELEQYLLNINFQKEITVRAMREGEILFPNQPVISLKGPVALCQYVERKILGILNDDVKIASKAARIVISAEGRPVFEFGGRRLGDAGTSAARAAYIAGCAGSSSVAAFAKYGVPCSGTMGHVWVMSHYDGGEKEAFENWNDAFKNSIYLVDTYNSSTGTENAIKSAGLNIGGIRLDSGDLENQSINFKRKLINSDCYSAKIYASNDLNEYKISELVQRRSLIDGFGVGTELVTSPDAPNCGFVFKLCSVQDKSGTWHPVAKMAKGGKRTIPGEKQVFRFRHDVKNTFTHDMIGLHNESIVGAEPLLVERSLLTENIEDSRNYCLSRISSLPPYLKIISINDNVHDVYTVNITNELGNLADNLFKNFNN